MGDAPTVAKLVFRTYDHHQRDEWTKKSLNLIDQLCLEGIGEAQKQMAEFERSDEQSSARPFRRTTSSPTGSDAQPPHLNRNPRTPMPRQHGMSHESGCAHSFTLDASSAAFCRVVMFVDSGLSSPLEVEVAERRRVLLDRYFVREQESCCAVGKLNQIHRTVQFRIWRKIIGCSPNLVRPSWSRTGRSNRQCRPATSPISPWLIISQPLSASSIWPAVLSRHI